MMIRLPSSLVLLLPPLYSCRLTVRISQTRRSRFFPHLFLLLCIIFSSVHTPPVVGFFLSTLHFDSPSYQCTPHVCVFFFYL